MDNVNQWVQINLAYGVNPDSVREILTRLGIGDSRKKILYQTCHLISYQGCYYIMHFKELFPLIGKEMKLVEGDLERRNKIIKMLCEWNIITVVNPEKMYDSYDVDIYLDDSIKVFKIGRNSDYFLRKMFNVDLLANLEMF